jgi:phospholipase/lecithinase/hemolysin
LLVLLTKFQGDFMRLRSFLLSAGFLAILPAALPSTAWATSYSAVVVYGDSLSDNGNLYTYDAGVYPPSPPYDGGRFSNGPVAVEQLATGLGAQLYDFAVGGATTGVGNYVDGGTTSTPGLDNLPGMQVELAESTPLLTSSITSSALFVVWGGANDFLTGGSALTAASDVDGIVASLEADGAKNILVPGLPNLGLTPDYLGTAGAAIATAYTLQFNAALQAGLPSGAEYVDTFALLNQIEADPGAYGITDTTDACFNGVTVCANPSQYLFWDGFHPTTAVDAIVAQDFANVASTPEPSSILLMGTGMMGVALLMRQRRLV